MATDEAQQPTEDAVLDEDPRMARLRTMHSQYADPEALAEPPAPAQDEDELFEFDEDYDEDFEDHEPEPEAEPEPEPEPEPEDDDVRMASLRKANKSFVDDKALTPHEEEEIPIEFDEEALGKAKTDIPVLTCVRCGTENEAHETVCSNCGAKLPKLAQMDDTQKYAPGSITGTLSRFQDAAAKVRGGEWNEEELADFVEYMFLTLNSLQLQYRAFVDHTRYVEDSPAEVRMVHEGMEEFEAGVEHFYAYIQEGEEAYLDEGLEMMRQANDKLIEGLRLNREYRKGIADQLDFNL